MFKSYRPWVVLVAVLFSVVVVLKYADALTQSVLKSSTKAHKYRVTYVDIANAPGVSVEPYNFCKRLTVYTMGAQDQILTWVSKLVVPFHTPTETAGVFPVSLRPVQGGIEVSPTDVAFLPELDGAPYLETRLGNGIQFNFFSDSVSTDIVFTVCAQEDLNQLTQGTIDFYVYKVE